MKPQKILPLLTAVLLLLSLTACKSGGEGKNTTADGTTGPKADHYHEYIDHVFPPTCVADGQTYHTCHICGDTYSDSIVPALGHTYANGIVTEPTCDAGGYTTHTCTVCGHSYRDAETPKREHIYIPNIYAPTCSAEGYTKHICAYCRDSYTDTPTEKTPHNYNNTVVSPTGTEQGYTEHTCYVCGYSYRDNYTDPVIRTSIVDFDPNGGKLPTLQVTYTYRSGENVELPVPTREGYVFDGWYRDVEDDTTHVENGPWSVVGHTWLTARWSPIEVEFTLNMGEGGHFLIYNRDIITWGESIGTLPTPEAKFGYTFDGWYDGDTRITPDTLSSYTEPVTFVGKWFAPIASAHVSGGDSNDYDWAVYHDGTLRFSPAAGAESGSAAFTIANGTFRGMSEIVRVELPNTVTDIGNYAFADCPNLKSITVPGSARVIRSSVFEGCAALESVTVGSGISVINEDAFKGCSSLTEITLPLSLFQIYSPFEGCTALARVNYEGTAFQWSVIVKDDAAKSALGAEGLTYTYEVTYSKK